MHYLQHDKLYLLSRKVRIIIDQ